MKTTVAELVGQLPGKVSERWPSGEQFVQAFTHGSMKVEFYAPVGSDPQVPHEQDELYFVHSGAGVLVIAGEAHLFAAGACFFVPAGVEHRFENFSADFSTWVVFWGPVGGES